MSDEPSSTKSKMESLATQADRLRMRLRSLRRFRRKTLHDRAARLETILTDLLIGANDLHGSAASSPTEHVSIEEHQRILANLEKTQSEYRNLFALLGKDRSTDDSAKVGELRDDRQGTESKHSAPSTIPRPLVDDTAVLHGQIEFLESELDKLHRSVDEHQAEEIDLREQIEVLRTQLLESRHETIELRIQNADLEERRQSQQSELSWAERRAQLIEKLEAEGAGFPNDSNESTRLRDLIESSQAEIEKRDRIIEERDREIDELQMLLTRQSTTTNGLAVGAAAIAQVLDSDEFIREERSRVEQLKCELEEKLRAAEIEISMERAKLARERLENEMASAQATTRQNEADEDMRAMEQQAVPTDGSPPVKRRRWLNRLGLKE